MYELTNGILKVKLPWPPTINHYYIDSVARKQVKGKTRHFVRKVIGKDGLKFRSKVKSIINNKSNYYLVQGLIGVSIQACIPDKRKRDIDNIFKPTLDALTHAYVWHDDKQVEKLYIERGPQIKGGCLYIQITELER